MTERAQPLTCRDVVELVSDYLEGALGADEAREFDQHLATCDGCATYVEQMRQTIAAVGRLRHETVPAHARDQLLATFRDWKRS
jgi:anti-sigma factor RsiW